MQMQEYLIDKAIDQIWCNPLQDNQIVVEPARVTSGAGAIVSVFMLDRLISLPWKKNRAHVFQVGQVSPALLGLFEKDPSWRKEQWYTFEEAMNTLPLYVSIYNESGVSIPRFNAQFMFTREKCLIFAIKQDNRIPMKLGSDNIYFRFYTNAYLKTLTPDVTKPPVQVKGYEQVTPVNIDNIIFDYNLIKQKPGYTEAYINGNWVSELSMRTLKPGSIVEWIYEADVKRTVSWTVKDLKPFTSTMDQKGKYILHYPKTTSSDTIDYHDDIDVYVMTNGEYNTKVGRYYIKNVPDAMRNLTHRDYSIVADYVTFLSNKLAEDLGLVIPDILDFEIFIKIREGGYNRKLIMDSNRIYDLYRLEDYRIMMAMSGVETLVPMWHAPNLEASAYTYIMGARLKDITIDKVEDAYGYNSITRILADTPALTKSVGTIQVGKLGYEAALGSTVYEYDRYGKMLGYFYHDTSDDDYDARYPQTKMIEAIIGEGTVEATNAYGFTDIPIPDKCSWRLYHSRMDFSHNPPIPFNDWTDITDSDRYEVQDGKIVWVSPETDQYLCLKTDKSFIAYDFQATQRMGVIVFQLKEIVVKDGVKVYQDMDIPPGDIQIFLNKDNLIRDVDYVVNFPYVSINSQRSINQPAQTAVQNIHIRMTGFCDKDMEIPYPTEQGFVRNGLISNNGTYFDHTNKIMHISIGGAVYDRSQVKFYEDNRGWYPRDPLNGKPYQINNTITPLRDFTKSDTYDLLEKAKAIDKEIDAYMDLYWPKPQNEPLSSSEVRWRLTSPFFSCIVELMVSNAWYWEDYERVPDSEIRRLCAPYENLLDYDPITNPVAAPELYVNITPTRYTQPVMITRAQYRVLEAIVRLYGRGRIGINNFVSFTVK